MYKFESPMNSSFCRIVLIGSGNVATRLGKAFRSAGHSVLQVWSRNREHAEVLARELGAEALRHPDAIEATADLVLVAVNDSAIEKVLGLRSWDNLLLVHTSGSLPMDVLAPFSTRRGVFYPFQTLSRQVEVNMQEVPVLTEASNENDLALLNYLGKSISGRVEPVSSEERARLHLAGVFCSNFINHMLALGMEYARKEGLDSALLHPLIRETVRKALENNPRDVQTGPAVRGDANVIKKHLSLLESHPDLQKMYTFVTESIQAFHH